MTKLFKYLGYYILVVLNLLAMGSMIPWIAQASWYSFQGFIIFGIPVLVTFLFLIDTSTKPDLNGGRS